MHAQEIKGLCHLEDGQLWKVEHGYLRVLERTEKFIHYKVLQQPDQADAMTRMIGLEALVNYLRHSEAELVT